MEPSKSLLFLIENIEKIEFRFGREVKILYVAKKKDEIGLCVI